MAQIVIFVCLLKLRVLRNFALIYYFCFLHMHLLLLLSGCCWSPLKVILYFLIVLVSKVFQCFYLPCFVFNLYIYSISVCFFALLKFSFMFLISLLNYWLFQQLNQISYLGPELIDLFNSSVELTTPCGHWLFLK